MMKLRMTKTFCALLAAAVLMPAISGPARAALVNAITGHTNDFSTQPPAGDWSTRSFGGTGGTAAGEITGAAALDAAVQTNSAALITAGTTSSAVNPPAAASGATWSSTGGYLQTRPTSTAVTLLMATLTNNTGTNATSIRIQYDYVTNRAGTPTEEVRGHRVYYSLSGTAGSWSNLAALSQTTQGTLVTNLVLSATWTNGARLLLLWADDNGSGTPDDANDIDNFSVQVTGLEISALACSLTAPANGQSLPDTNTLALAATASPGPGATNVSIGFYDATAGLLGSDLTAPFGINVALGAGVYQLYAVATNDLGATTFSATNIVTVTNVPFSVALNSPTNGTTHGTPTNVAFAASAYGGSNATITGVAYFDAVAGWLADAFTPPFNAAASLSGGTFNIFAVATNSLGATASSRTNTVVINVPATNTLAPVIYAVNPPHSTPVSNLTSVTVTFSEPVSGVDAADLLVEGVPATGVSGSGSNYIFTFPQPPYGQPTISWATNHGITDFGWPTVLPFDANGSGATWGYYLLDQTPPVLAARTPAPGSTITGLTQVIVTFSEAVSGVDAADLLINGTAASGVTGGGSNYTFTVAQPSAYGPLAINVSWATNHGIADLALTPNAFGGTGWNFTLDPLTVLVPSNSMWRFLKGTAEASSPTNAWRLTGFNDSAWSNAPAPFFYGDPYSNGLAAFTLLSDMQSNYATIYLRTEFTVAGAAAITNLYLNAQSDDGFIAWINGVEVQRYNVAAGEIGYSGLATTQSPEPNNRGAAYTNFVITNASAFLVNGTNLLTVHALNQSLAGSSDFGFNAQLHTYLSDAGSVPPRITLAVPASGEVFALTNITLTFSEDVSGVDAADLLVNGVPATGVESNSARLFNFTFTQPAFGPVLVTWDTNHGIADLDEPPKPFNSAGPGATFSLSLVNPAAPVIAARSPAAGSSVSNLVSVSVTFSKAVTGVDAADLLVNGAPASGVSGSGSNHVFVFPLPSYGAVAITWASDHGIVDADFPTNAFDGMRPTNVWSYTLLDQLPPVVASQNPPAGANVTNLTQITVSFSEPVSGVTAGDLLINGIPATNVGGGPANYTFTFAQPNGSSINVTWAAAHGIRDLALAPNPFNAAGPGATWSYATPDTVPPDVGVIAPPAGSTVRYLTHLSVTFDEPVSGVDAGDLLVNSVPAQSVTGAGAGPYFFVFAHPATGTVQVAFAPGHGIHDSTGSSNGFSGAAWNYELNPALPVDIAATHVIQMSLDGLGAKYLQFYVSNAPAQFPNFVRLMNEGAFTFNARCDYDISETVPNHATMFTGRPVLQPSGSPATAHHGYNNNFPVATETLHNSGNTNVPYKNSMFDVAHDYGRTTAFYAGKTRLDICDRSFNGTNGALDLIGADNGRDKIDFSSVLDISGTSISNEVNTILADLTSPVPKEYTFIHIAEPDLTGHSTSWGSASWSNAVRMVDTQLGRILAAIDAHPLLSNQTALIVTADHGGGGVTVNAHTEAYHITNYTVPFFLRAPGIAGGTDLYAVFANRGNPGTNRTDYTTNPQPIRNGDGSNLALSLLGLPPIPGSFMVPGFTVPSVTLRTARYGAQAGFFWFDPNDEFDLEAQAALGTAWQTVTNGITTADTTKVFTITNGMEFPARFFRLKKK